MSEKKLIDLEELFKAKNPQLYKWIPGFVFSFLKRIIHEDETNRFVETHFNDDAFQFCKGVTSELGVTFDVFNIENVPKTGGCIVVCNHPMGALEAMSMVTALQKVRTDLKFIVNDLLLTLHNLKEVMIGVNKHGRVSAESLRMVNELFSSEQLILIFPSGLVSRKINGVIQDLEWKKTFISQAKKYNKPVIPVYFQARNSNFFYNFGLIRRKLGIKANLEMFLLVDEMYRQRGKYISIVFGNIIEPATFTNSKTDTEWAAYVRNELYKLKETLK